MSDILARLRVTETHGIRRFLYPLTAYLPLPDDTDFGALSLATAEGQPVPVQVTPHEAGLYRVDFAVSLAPLQADMDLMLTRSGPQVPIPDPLNLTYLEHGSLRSEQERFQITLGAAGEVRGVVYDGVPHLKEPSKLGRADLDNRLYKRGLITAGECVERFGGIEAKEVQSGGGPLRAWSRTQGLYPDGRRAQITTEITACKSWVTLHYRLEQPRPDELIMLNLPLGGEFAEYDPLRTTFDTGINGIYGRADRWGSFLNWYAPGESIRWEIGREFVPDDGSWTAPKDYVGTTATEAEFQQQRWFHLVNGNKAVAVAITQMPSAWASLEIRMSGHMKIWLRLAGNSDSTDSAEFGVCYHFLNDVPAIAAATNPQSILLPPTVEVLAA